MPIVTDGFAILPSIVRTVQIRSAENILDLVETDQTDPAGRWRFRANGDKVYFEKATAANWGSHDSALLMGSLGATCFVVASDAKNEIKDFAQLLQDLGYPVWVCKGEDDQVEIQAAVDACGPRGIVLLSRGNFYTRQPILMKNRVSIRGVGFSGTKINLADGSNCNIIEFSPTGSQEGSWEISYMTIDGNKANQSSGHGVYVSDDGGEIPYDIRLGPRFFASNCKGDGIRIKNAWAPRLIEIHSEFNEVMGVRVEGASTTGLIFTESYVSDNGNTGVVVTVTGGLISNIRSTLNGWHGFDLTVMETQLSNLQAFANGQDGFVFSTSARDSNIVASQAIKSTGTMPYGFHIKGDRINLIACQSLDATTQDVLFESGADNNVLLGGYFNSVSNSGSNNIIRFNAGYITRLGKSDLEWTDGKLLKGAGPGNDPIEIDPGSVIPSGLIMIWHGTIASIPSGFVICDGNNSTPNLLAKFVEGVATAATDPGATGGATSKNAENRTQVNRGTTDALNGNYDRYDTTITISDIRPPYYDVAFIMKT